MTLADFIFKYANLSVGKFKDQTNQEIGADDMRDFTDDIGDSFVNKQTDGFFDTAFATGTNSYTATLNPAPEGYVSGHRVTVKVVNASTGPVTFNFNGFGAKKLFKDPTTQANSGDIPNNQILNVVYDSSLDSGVGGFLAIGSMSTGGGAVSDGSKGGVLVSSSGTVWTPTDHAFQTVSTAGSTITLPFASKERGYFAGSATFTTNKTIAFDSDSRATQFDFIFDTNANDVTLDFGASTRSTHPDFVSGVFTAVDIGLHKVHGTRYGPGGLWILDFKGVYSVGDTPPTPTDQWILTTGIWNDSEYWDDDAYWKD